MEQSDYIPQPYGLFFDWQGNLITMIAAKETDWNIPHAKVLELQGKQTIYTGLYNTANTPATKTKSANVAHEEGRKVFEKDIRNFVNEFLTNNSAITTQQKIDAGLNPHLNTGSPRPFIETSPSGKLIPLGGGFMRFEFRVANDSSRPSIHKKSDGLEMRYAIIGKDALPTPGPGPGPGVNDFPAPEDCPHEYFSTKARFKLEMGNAAIGKVLVVYPRWKNNTDPSKSSPYPTIPAFGLIG